jgi:adenine-specific DNA-methyltransferase
MYVSSENELNMFITIRFKLYATKKISNKLCGMTRKDYNNLNKDQLIEVIEKLEKGKKYGLVWDEERVPEKILIDCSENLPVLTEIKDKDISKDENEPTHIIIEGDNFHALSVLNYTHYGKIDVIYIDPPFNTGAKDWKYNNAFVDKNDTWRHSKWIQFMYNRLKIAKNLLSDDGVLICAIDHNEQENLGVLLRELFGNNEITCVTIIHNPSGIQGDNFSHNNEYAYFVYPKKKNIIGPEIRDEESADIRGFMNGAKGNTNAYKRETGYDCFYPIIINEEKIIQIDQPCPSDFHPSSPNVLTSDGSIEVYPIDEDGVERKWLFTRGSVDEIHDELSVNFNSSRNLYEIKRTKTQINYKTVWTHSKYNAKTYGTLLVKEIVGKDFPFPKSLYNTLDCIESVVRHRPNATILDYFAGSGTTGHAVMEMNKLDGGKRNAILCTNNESKICDEILYPRLSKCINGYDFKGKEKKILLEKKVTYTILKKADKLIKEINDIVSSKGAEYEEFQKTFDGQTFKLIGIKNIKGYRKGYGGNLKYYSTSFVKNKSNKDQLKQDITQRCTQMLCLKEGIYTLLKETQDWKIFKRDNRFLAVYYDFISSSLEDLKGEMIRLDGEKVMYYFTIDPAGLDRDQFIGWGKIRLEPIPQKILDIYRQIFKNT